jgi:hypothetical protein
MKISHEVPLCLLEDSLKFNDYQYILPHLIDKFPQYKEFMLKYREQPESFIIQDNGLFENVNHTEEDLIEKINLTKPDIFIVPDMWNNPSVCKNNAKHWMRNIKPQLPESTQLMVVLQGRNRAEIIGLCQDYKWLGYKHIACNHSSAAYQTVSYFHNPLLNQMFGRLYLVSYMKQYDYIDNTDYIHLLGASIVDEFKYYSGPDFEFIKSCDTSAPIISGYNGTSLSNNILTKSSTKIDDIMEKELVTKQKDLIFHNVNYFKSLIKN